MVEQLLQGDACACRHPFLCGLEFAAYRLGIRLRVGQPLPDAVKLTQYAHLHLLCRLVGKGDGKDVAVALGIGYQQLDIVDGKAKGLSAAGTRLVDGQRGRPVFL